MRLRLFPRHPLAHTKIDRFSCALLRVFQTPFAQRQVRLSDSQFRDQIAFRGESLGVTPTEAERAASLVVLPRDDLEFAQELRAEADFAAGADPDRVTPGG
jgi:hypothetical protein